MVYIEHSLPTLDEESPAFHTCTFSEQALDDALGLHMR